jgi:hypothetical protein
MPQCERLGDLLEGEAQFLGPLDEARPHDGLLAVLPLAGLAASRLVE